MNEAVKKMWVDALRSGQYKKTKGIMIKETEKEKCFCAFGVLCELAHQEGIVERVSVKDYTLGMIVEYGNPDEIRGAYYPPDSVHEWAGLEHGRIHVAHKGGGSTITYLNDELDLSFNEIADLIEAQL